MFEFEHSSRSRIVLAESFSLCMIALSTLRCNGLVDFFSCHCCVMHGKHELQALCFSGLSVYYIPVTKDSELYDYADGLG